MGNLRGARRTGYRPGRWLALLLIGAWVLTGVAPVAASAPLPPAIQAKFDPGFLRQVLGAPGDRLFRFLITLQPQANLDGLPSGLSRSQQRAVVVERLQAVASEAQERLRPVLVTLAGAGHLDQVRPFWIFDGMALQGDRASILALAARDEVRAVREDRWQQWIGDLETSRAVTPAAGVDWGIAQIRADQVWSALRIDGTGVTIATVDTGVDWLHPALQPAYRGYHNGSAIHAGSWYDATGGGAAYPVDSTGHGTQVTGLAVGQNGIGVAPGAQWIAVRAFDSNGYGLNSWIHAAFEWLLAPEGNPEWAPDIVSNSWSSARGQDTEFRPDLQAMRSAGILPVFAAGNYGSQPRSIGSPASYPEALAVGATDQSDQVASFSGRGPGPLGGVKPELAAPGVNVFSSLPGGSYGSASGTSFATPLAAGVAALLHQADPGIAWDQVTRVMTGTAVPVGEPWPNPDAGWGRVDALAAVESVLQSGHLEGVVRGLRSVPRSAGVGVEPLVGAAVRATEHGGGAEGQTLTGPAGEWSLALSPGIYDLEVSFFGYAPGSATGLQVLTGTVTRQDLVLVPLPGGVVEGQISDAAGGAPLPAVIRVAGAPVTTTADLNGWFSLSLPAGSHTLSAEHWGHRVGREPVSVAIGGSTRQDFSLERSPRLLLVDSGAWYYESEIDYYQTALDNQDYLYHQWTVHTPWQDTPVITDLMPYDGVIWSSPLDSPGYVGAGGVISDYLRAGGNLLLSGQDVGFWESGASGFVYAPYYRQMLKAVFLHDDANSSLLTGLPGGILDSLTLTLNDPDSARNQISPDAVGIEAPEHAEPVLAYDTAEWGGIATGLCLPYRSFYLSFGLEGAGDRARRAQLVGTALDWITSPRRPVGLELSPAGSAIIAPAGSTVAHTLQLFNSGEAGNGDHYVLSLDGARWHTSILTPTVTLSPCATSRVAIQVQVPAGLGVSSTDRATLTVRSTVSPTLVATAALTTQTPAAILLVDDDRWYDQEAAYQQALDAASIPYDYWDSGGGAAGKPATPPTQTLGMYPLVLWFTGYDWYSPITQREAQNLVDYLDTGGRLFLSSQDALYYQHDSLLAGHYWGVLSHREDVTPTIAFGAGGRLAISGEFPLGYPFRNFSDGIVPIPGAAGEIVNDSGWVMGASHAGDGWKSVFFAFPFETLPSSVRPDVMNQVVGWLSWLGESEFQASATRILPGETVHFTATLRNDGREPVTANYSNPLPAGYHLISGSLAGATLQQGAVVWQGLLVPGEEHSLHYAGTASETLTNTAVLSYPEHDLAFRRSVQVWVNSPDLRPFEIGAAPSPVMPGRGISYTLRLVNRGTDAAPAANAFWWLPAEVTVLSDTVRASSGSLSRYGRFLHWWGNVLPGESITVSAAALAPRSLQPDWLSSVAMVRDGFTAPLGRYHLLPLRPARLYLPVVFSQ